MFLRKYIVKCNIDLEHNRVWSRVARPEFMNPLHNSSNWIFQISHHTQIINIHSSGKLASELLGLFFFFNSEVISTYRCCRVFVIQRLCPQDLCSAENTPLKSLAELSADQKEPSECFLIGASEGVKRIGSDIGGRHRGIIGLQGLNVLLDLLCSLGSTAMLSALRPPGESWDRLRLQCLQQFLHRCQKQPHLKTRNQNLNGSLNWEQQCERGKTHFHKIINEEISPSNTSGVLSGSNSKI